jgi:hypothetical protein
MSFPFPLAPMSVGFHMRNSPPEVSVTHDINSSVACVSVSTLLQSSYDVSVEKNRRHSQPGCRFSYQSRDVGGDIACYAFISAFVI